MAVQGKLTAQAYWWNFTHNKFILSVLKHRDELPTIGSPPRNKIPVPLPISKKNIFLTENK